MQPPTASESEAATALTASDGMATLWDDPEFEAAAAACTRRCLAGHNVGEAIDKMLFLLTGGDDCGSRK
jgi:hypothetical protein